MGLTPFLELKENCWPWGKGRQQTHGHWRQDHGPKNPHTFLLVYKNADSNSAAILPLPCRIPGLRSLGLWVSPLHSTPRLPPRGHFQDCHASPFQKDLVLSGPWAHCNLWCSRPHWGVFNKSSTPTTGSETILLHREWSHMKVSPVSHSMAQEGGSRTRTLGLAAQGCIWDSRIARAQAPCSAFLLTQWFCPQCI